MNKEQFIKYKDLMQAWAEGAVIQYFDKSLNKWVEVFLNQPSWSTNEKYRIKPVKKTPYPVYMDAA